MEQTGVGNVRHRKFVQILLTEESILYTIIRGERKTGVVYLFTWHSPVHVLSKKEKRRRRRSEELK